MPKRIPVKALKNFAKEQGLTHAVLFAMDGKLDHIVTYGQTVEQCSQAADFGNTMKDLLGWPESLHAQPPRVKKLEKSVKELESAIAEYVFESTNRQSTRQVSKFEEKQFEKFKQILNANDNNKLDSKA